MATRNCLQCCSRNLDSWSGCCCKSSVSIWQSSFGRFIDTKFSYYIIWNRSNSNTHADTSTHPSTSSADTNSTTNRYSVVSSRLFMEWVEWHKRVERIERYADK